MAVRPNIRSLDLQEATLLVRGQSSEPLPAVIEVVVVQRSGAGADRFVAVARGHAERAATSWKAVLEAADLETGPAETLGVEIRIDPFEVTSWVQSVTIA